MKTQVAFLGKHINMAPRVHRRWLVVATYAAFAAFIVAWSWFSKSMFFAWCLIAVTAVSIMVSSLVGRPTDEVDEREAHRWDHVHARAYHTLGWALVLALFAGSVHTYVSATTHPRLFAVLQQLPYSILMAAGVLYATLPQAMLLWTEPDMEEELRG